MTNNRALMKTIDVIREYGSQAAAAKVARVSAPSLHAWPEYPPDNRQLALQVVTQGRLMAEPGALGRVLGLDRMTDEDVVEALFASIFDVPVAELQAIRA